MKTKNTRYLPLASLLFVLFLTVYFFPGDYEGMINPFLPVVITLEIAAFIGGGGFLSARMKRRRRDDGGTNT